MSPMDSLRGEDRLQTQCWSDDMGHNDQRIASFFSRVKFERDVLRAINTLPYVRSHLNGLSPQARQAWISTDPAVASHAEVTQILDEAWSLVGQLADHSRTVFENVASGEAEMGEFLRRLAIFSADLGP